MKDDIKDSIVVLQVCVVAVGFVACMGLMYTLYVEVSTHNRIEAIETQLAIDANCIATLEVLQQAREEKEAGK